MQKKYSRELYDQMKTNLETSTWEETSHDQFVTWLTQLVEISRSGRTGKRKTNAEWLLMHMMQTGKTSS